MDLFLLLLLAAALCALFAIRGSPTRIRLQPLAAAPGREDAQCARAERDGGAPVTDPRRSGDPAATLWQLHASPGCPLTRAVLDGRRFRGDEAIPLPTLGCDDRRCGCHYRPVRNARRGERRRNGVRPAEPGAAVARERRSPWTRRQARAAPADA